MEKHNLITISYAKRALDVGSREHERMLQYASTLGELHIVVLTRKSDGYSAVLKKDNLYIYPTNAGTKVGVFFKAISLTRRILKAKKTSWIVSSQDPFETSLIAQLACIGTSARQHVQIHGDALNPRVDGTGIQARCRRLYARYILKRVGCIRVVSERIKRSLLALGVHKDRIHVVPIQVDMQQFLQIGDNRTYERIGRFKYLFVGRFSPEKNIPLIITALKNAITSGADIELACVGAGPLEARLKQLCTELDIKDRVTFVSWTNDIPGMMREADALVLASDHEGWGMVLVEAMAAGLPVVTTDVGCAGEMLVHEEHGLVVPVGDTKAFAAALTTLASNRKQATEYGQAGHQKAAASVLSTEEYLSRWCASFTCGNE